MKSILVAAAFALAITLLGTPIAIKAFRVWGWGQRIREDGPHTHLEKMGTPTMGGIVILIGLLGGFLASRFTFQHLTPAGLALLFAAVGFGVVGFLDDFLKVRTGSLARVVEVPEVPRDGGRLDPVRGASSCTSRPRRARRPSCRSSAPPGINLGVLFYVWAFVILTASSHSVNLTDGLDGLASGSSILVLSAFMFIAFWQFRHACGLGPPEACYAIDPGRGARHRDRGGGDDGRRHRVPVVERGAGADLHGGHRLARARWGVRRAGDHAQHAAAADRPRRAVRDRDDVGDPAGDLVPRVRPTDLPDVADPPSLRAGRLAGVHGDRAVLDHRRALRRGRDRPVLRRLHQQGWSRDERRRRGPGAARGRDRRRGGGHRRRGGARARGCGRAGQRGAPDGSSSTRCRGCTSWASRSRPVVTTRRTSTARRSW